MNLGCTKSVFHSELKESYHKLQFKDKDAWTRAHSLANEDRDPLAQAIVAIGCDKGWCSFDEADGFAHECLGWLQSQQGGYALFCLGCFYSRGIAVKSDPKKAVRAWRKAAATGCELSAQILGKCHMIGHGVHQMASSRGNQGYADAQFDLGYHTMRGEGVAKDVDEALRLCRLAAEQGHTFAQCTIAEAYRDGEGVEKDLNEAARWYRKAADRGYHLGLFTLGSCYDEGEGVEKNSEEAVRLYRMAADQGSVEGQYNLGYCFEHGRGVKRNRKEAVGWYRKAAEAGESNAQHALGSCYYYGRGVDKDMLEAAKWFQLASNQGHPGGDLMLGWMMCKWLSGAAISM